MSDRRKPPQKPARQYFADTDSEDSELEDDDGRQMEERTLSRRLQNISMSSPMQRPGRHQRGGTSASGASTSGASAATPQPSQWSSRTPSEMVRQHRSSTGSPDFERWRRDRRYLPPETPLTGDFTPRGRELAERSRENIDLAYDYGRRSRQKSELEKKGYKKSQSDGRYQRQQSSASKSWRPKLLPQSFERLDTSPRFSTRLDRMDQKRPSAWMPTGRMDYGPRWSPSSNRRHRMSREDETRMEREFGYQETPRYWTPRQRSFADRLLGLDQESRDIYQNFRSYSDQNRRENVPARRRMVPPPTEYGTREAAVKRAKQEMNAARERAELRRGGRKRRLKYRDSVLPSSLQLETPLPEDVSPPRLRNISEEDASFEHSPTPFHRWTRLPQSGASTAGGVRHTPSATYTPMSAQSAQNTQSRYETGQSFLDAASGRTSSSATPGRGISSWADLEAHAQRNREQSSPRTQSRYPTGNSLIAAATGQAPAAPIVPVSSTGQNEPHVVSWESDEVGLMGSMYSQTTEPITPPSRGCFQFMSGRRSEGSGSGGGPSAQPRGRKNDSKDCNVM